MGLVEMLSQNIDYFKSKPVNIPKITILLDHGYHPEYLTQKLEQIYPQIMTKIRFELSTKPSKQQKAAQGKSGFVPAVARWVIERSNAWMERCKILVKNFERTLSNATTKINLCFIRLMIKRLSLLEALLVKQLEMRSCLDLHLKVVNVTLWNSLLTHIVLFIVKIVTTVTSHHRL
jgi:hypothetical protein